MCSTHTSRKQQFGTEHLLGKRVYAYADKFPLCRSIEGYPCISFYGATVLVHRLVDGLTNGPIPKGWDVHHKDEDRTNYHWTNLQRMPHEEHAALHHRKPEGRHGTPRWDK